jgi:hypothetical protein
MVTPYSRVYSGGMGRHENPKKWWVDPVKNVPARKDTLDTPGSFTEFGTVMRRIVNKHEGRKRPRPSASRVPASF